MKYICLLLTLLNLTAFSQQKITWPGGKKAVIVLTYDDALPSQLNNAVPQLLDAGLPATFFLTGDINAQTIDKWRALAAKGYELGNHTIFHPCPAEGNDNSVKSEKYTAYSMIREIEVMNHFLYAVDGKNSRTYAYPCAEVLAGGKSYVDTLKYYGLVKYARVGGDSTAIITNFKNLNPLLIPSWGLEDYTSGARLIAHVKRVQASGGMGIIMLHGIGAEYLTTDIEAHRQLIAYLKANQKDIWVCTFQQAMDYVKQAGGFIPSR